MFYLPKIDWLIELIIFIRFVWVLVEFQRSSWPWCICRLHSGSIIVEQPWTGSHESSLHVLSQLLLSKIGFWMVDWNGLSIATKGDWNGLAVACTDRVPVSVICHMVNEPSWVVAMGLVHGVLGRALSVLSSTSALLFARFVLNICAPLATSEWKLGLTLVGSATHECEHFLLTCNSSCIKLSYPFLVSFRGDLWQRLELLVHCLQVGSGSFDSFLVLGLTPFDEVLNGHAPTMSYLFNLALVDIDGECRDLCNQCNSNKFDHFIQVKMNKFIYNIMYPKTQLY